MPNKTVTSSGQRKHPSVLANVNQGWGLKRAILSTGSEKKYDTIKNPVVQIAEE